MITRSSSTLIPILWALSAACGSGQSPGADLDLGRERDLSAGLGSDLGGDLSADASLDQARDQAPDAAIQDAAPDAQTEPTVWPNPAAPSNSHPWLRQHHARLTQLRPRVLVLDVMNGQGLTPTAQLAQGLAEAFGQMSRHLAYRDPEAPVFLSYEIDRVVDLRDPGGAAYPDFWPAPEPFRWDVGELFTPEFAPRLGYRDPDSPGRFLTMCELFERGVIHELWIAAGFGHNIYENQSRVQVYDEALEPIPGRFDGCTNGCFHDPRGLVSCGVTVRMQEINRERGVGCGTHAAGHAMEHLRRTIPYVGRTLSAFMGFSLDETLGLPLPDLYACPYEEGLCVDFPSPGRIVSGPRFPGPAFDVEGWGQGCGNVHFAPNSRAQYDYYSELEALSSCAAYGVPGAQPEPYTWAVTQRYELRHGDCGGGWMVYWGQSLPGLGTRAVDERGQPLLSFWPFLFY